MEFSTKMNNINFDQGDINRFIAVFKEFPLNGGWQIKVNGRTIKTKSGKSLWQNKAHAKNALKNHFANVPRDMCLYLNLSEKYLGNKYAYESNKLWNNFVDFLEAKGILEFVELK